MHRVESSSYAYLNPLRSLTHSWRGQKISRGRLHWFTQPEIMRRSKPRTIVAAGCMMGGDEEFDADPVVAKAGLDRCRLGIGYQITVVLFRGEELRAFMG